MAHKVTVELTDDIDGGEATQTVTFAVRGAEYEIDLSDVNAASFDEILAPYIAHARRVSTRRRPTGSSGAVPAGIDPKAVREWAARQGIDVGLRGRISATIVEQYRSAA